jgi:proteasome lid subunit RPN8/RPN11
MSRLLLTPDQRTTIERHLQAGYPEEACGILLGRAEAAGETVVERVLPLANERPDSRHNRYLIAPEAVLAAHREARAASLDVVGYFHSHPDCPAVPSTFDREHAWPGLSYVIVSVVGGEAVSLCSWRLAEDREQFVEERVETTALAGVP